VTSKLKVLRLAYRLYFRNASFLTRFSCGFRLLRHRFFGISAPISVMIGLTYRCQCRCVHCGMKLLQDAEGAELSTEEVKKVIEAARRLGTVEITLFGGEPLLRADLEEIVAHARDSRMLPSLDTNGLELSAEKIGGLKGAGLSALKVSLDSPDVEEHDRLRGVEGCFEKAVTGLRQAVAAGLPCAISTYATRENVRSGDLRRLIELGRELGVTAVRIIDTTLSGCFLHSLPRRLAEPDRRELARLLEPGFVFLENLASSRALTHPICSALARRYAYVSPYGDLQPCCFVPLSFGNVRRDPLRKILGRLWSSNLMDYDPGRCLMNNRLFREKYLSQIDSAAKLPLEFREEGRREAEMGEDCSAS